MSRVQVSEESRDSSESVTTRVEDIPVFEVG
jgi:hypothetical protein